MEYYLNAAMNKLRAIRFSNLIVEKIVNVLVSFVK